jgi:hypothetical protein
MILSAFVSAVERGLKEMVRDERKVIRMPVASELVYPASGSMAKSANATS